MLKGLYYRVMRLSGSPHANWALFAVAFAESSFFPVPPDVMLAPMVLTRPERTWRAALICTLGSVIGGILGYAIGFSLEPVGRWILAATGAPGGDMALRHGFAKWGVLVILGQGLLPIPYKLVTITSGLLGYNFPLFVALSVLTRGARFFLVAGVLHWFGEPLRTALERNFAAALAGFVALVVAGFVIAIKVF